MYAADFSHFSTYIRLLAGWKRKEYTIFVSIVGCWFFSFFLRLDVSLSNLMTDPKRCWLPPFLKGPQLRATIVRQLPRPMMPLPTLRPCVVLKGWTIWQQITSRMRWKGVGDISLDELMSDMFFCSTVLSWSIFFSFVVSTFGGRVFLFRILPCQAIDACWIEMLSVKLSLRREELMRWDHETARI